MDKNKLMERYKQDLLVNRAENFMGNFGSRMRTAADYKEDPELLTLELAKVVMIALCTSAVAGIKLDLNVAVETGKALYELEG